MVTSAWGGATDADLIGVLIDVERADNEENRALLDKLSGSHEPDGIHLIKPEMRIRQSTGPLKAHSES